jgi:hypothetical protein
MDGYPALRRGTAKLQEALKRLAKFIIKTPLQRASISCAH